MIRNEFKVVADQALEQLVSTAEREIGQSLPRSFRFSWIPGKDIVADGDVAEYLVASTFIDEAHIAPCFDLFLEKLLPDGRLLFVGYRAAYPPCEYGNHRNYESKGHDAGRVGPFKLGMAHIVEQLKKDRKA